MKTKTIETITRHLKGIVAALENEKEEIQKVTKYRGVALHKLSNYKLDEAKNFLVKNPSLNPVGLAEQFKILKKIDREIKSRTLK
jgi:hypothetical protein